MHVMVELDLRSRAGGFGSSNMPLAAVAGRSRLPIPRFALNSSPTYT